MKYIPVFIIPMIEFQKLSTKVGNRTKIRKNRVNALKRRYHNAKLFVLRLNDKIYSDKHPVKF